MTFPVAELAPHITEFQVAETDDGVLAAALGLRITERQGLLHNEAFTDFALADHLRSMFWDRMQNIAANQGLLRLWTQEQAPFWNRCGLARADEESATRLPAAWRGRTGPWFTLKLRDDVDALLKADLEFSLFMQAEREKTARALRRGKFFNAVALILVSALVIFALAAALYLFWKHQHPPGD